MAGSSKTAVVSAIGGNTFVMIAKFIAWGFTGSGSMLSEGIHSAADVLNQTLLLIGIVRSGKDADKLHPVGYGRERYIWSLMSAVGIFFLGCGVTVYHGVHSLLHPTATKGDIRWALGVLILSLIIEGYVFVVAYKGLKKEAGEKPFFNYVRNEADPAAAAVLLEDFAACLGIVIALSSIGLTHITGQVFWDSLGSITIGLLLGLVAIFLIIRNHTLLVGETVPEVTRNKIRKIILSHQSVEDIAAFKARMIDLETYDVMADIEFDGAVIAQKFEPKLREEYEKIKTFEDFESFTKRYADDVLQALGDEIDAIEEHIQKEVPEAKYLDLEMN